MSYLLELLGWVLLEAAWQTLAIAMLLLLSMRLLRGAPAARRYRCAVLHLAGAIAAVALTLVVSHASVAAGQAAALVSNAAVSWLPRLHDQSQRVLPVLTVMWLGGIAIAQVLLAVRFIRSGRFVSSAGPAGQEIVAMAEEMSGRMGLRRLPEVRCAEVASPMVAGWRLPILVVPNQFADTHPPAERRALLAHELAHVLRCDYSRNILQLLAASVLWWHPGVWLTYARIRHERECASDEQAVRITGSAAALAHALVRLASAAVASEMGAVAADSCGLADRIARLSGPPARPDRATTPACLAAVAAVLTVAVVAASVTASHGEGLTRAYAASGVGPPTVFTIQAQDPAGTFLVKMVRGRVVAIVLEQEPVPADHVVQRGNTVRVMGAAGQEVLRLEVDPRGGFRWKARRASGVS